MIIGKCRVGTIMRHAEVLVLPFWTLTLLSACILSFSLPLGIFLRRLATQEQQQQKREAKAADQQLAFEAKLEKEYSARQLELEQQVAEKEKQLSLQYLAKEKQMEQQCSSREQQLQQQAEELEKQRKEVEKRVAAAQQKEEEIAAVQARVRAADKLLADTKKVMEREKKDLEANLEKQVAAKARNDKRSEDLDKRRAEVKEQVRRPGWGLERDCRRVLGLQLSFVGVKLLERLSGYHGEAGSHRICYG